MPPSGQSVEQGVSADGLGAPPRWPCARGTSPS